MQVPIYALFFCIFFVPYLGTLGVVPHAVTWLPDVMSIVVLVIGVFTVATRKGLDLGLGYLSLLMMLAAVITAGLALNAVPSGVAFAGIRQYLKFLPLFILPAVYVFTDTQLRRQLGVLLAIVLMQLPVALYQRLVQFSGVLSGDVVTGTLKGSGVLSIFLLAAVAVLTGIHLKNHLRWRWYIGCVGAAFIPTTINETKVTLFVLPIALIVPLLFTPMGIAKGKRLIGITALLVLGVSVFVPVYDHFQLQRRDEGIVEFLMEENRVETYLERTGRAETVLKPTRTLAGDPATLLLGLGSGNVSESHFGAGYSGKYYARYGEQLRTTWAQWQWELGLLGVGTMLGLFLLVLRDARYLSKRDGDVTAGVSLGWIGVLAVLAVSLVYDRSVLSDEIGMLLWYLSGHIAATASRRRREGTRRVGLAYANETSA